MILPSPIDDFLVILSPLLIRSYQSPLSLAIGKLGNTRIKQAIVWQTSFLFKYFQKYILIKIFKIAKVSDAKFQPIISSTPHSIASLTPIISS